MFGLKQGWACLFGGLMLALLVGTHLFWPAHAPVARYDFLVLAAVAIQAGMLWLKLESWEEARIIFVFHVVGTIMEVFKTAHGSWIYPEPSLLRIGEVPLFSGFMYAAVGSYIARIQRIFDIRFQDYPPLWTTWLLAAAIYINFFSHHWLPDIRLGLFAATILLFGRGSFYFTADRKRRSMPFLLGFLLVALFIWFAENLGTLSRAWIYPDQAMGWAPVSVAKLGSWFLLMMISVVLVSVVRRPEAEPIKGPSHRVRRARLGGPAEQNVQLRSIDEWHEYLRSNRFAQSGEFAARLAEVVSSEGFVEPLTGRVVAPGETHFTSEIRETLRSQGLSSRVRAVLHEIERFGVDSETRIYAAEAVTPFAMLMRGRFPKFIGSEYASNAAVRDEMFPVLFQDLTQLDFPSGRFDIVTTNEVLEHVPDLDGALREIARVLRPGGKHIGTAPVHLDCEKGLVRARLTDGEIVHLEEPEYHGNPFEEGGALVFEIPSWDLLERARAAGFRDAWFQYVWSRKHGYLTEYVGVTLICMEK